MKDSDPLWNHVSSPFCWVERGEERTAIGGRDKLVEWVRAQEVFNGDSEQCKEVLNWASVDQPSLTEGWVDESPGSCQKN